MHQKNFLSIHSIAQDLTYNSSMGRKRTKRKVELVVCIKRITGSVDAVRWLNRFGHSISYDEINALETKLAEEQVNNQTNTSLVPTHIQPSESIYNTTLQWTNGIIIQQLDKQQVEATGNNSTIVSTERRKSFKPIYHELQPYIKEKERKNPIPIKQIETNINQLDGMLSRQEDLLRLLLRYRNKDNQVIPGRVSFMKSPKNNAEIETNHDLWSGPLREGGKVFNNNGSTLQIQKCFFYKGIVSCFSKAVL